MKFTLRPYQQTAVEKLRASYRRGRRAPLFVLPTGGGKTAVFSHIAENARLRGKRVSILVHRQELLIQASRSLERLGVSHGLISPKYVLLQNEPVQVASIQTLVRRLGKLPAPDLVIVDEAHHATSKSYRTILEAYPRAHILGVTATPIRGDGAGLGKDAGGVFDELIEGPSISDLIREGYLVQPVVYAPPVGIDLTGVKRKLGDYDRKELSERIDKPKITGDIVGHYLRHAPGEPAIAFCVSIEHADHVAAEFRHAGIRAVRVDGNMDDSSRRAAIEGLGNGSIDVLTSADLIGEGVDIPRVSAAILLRPTQSLALHLQQVGRALRPYEGKTRALVLDHVGNCMRHGLPDDDREWNLKATAYRAGKFSNAPVVSITQCEKCYFVYQSGPERCPKCAHHQPFKPRKIEVTEGELQKLTREHIEAAKKNKRVEVARAQSIDDLVSIGKQRGYANPRFWAEKVWGGRRAKE